MKINKPKLNVQKNLIVYKFVIMRKTMGKTNEYIANILITNVVLIEEIP